MKVFEVEEVLDDDELETRRPLRIKVWADCCKIETVPNVNRSRFLADNQVVAEIDGLVQIKEVETND